MKRSFLFASTVILLSACGNSSEPSLEGCWVRDDQKQLECWTLEGDALVGEGLAPTGHGDTLVFENLKLYTENGVRIYAARVGQDTAPVLFTETEPWVFENPEHDNPKRIAYEFIAPNTMKVTVGNGGAEGFTWTFIKED